MEVFSSNTETGVTAAYQDSDGTIDLVASITTSEISVHHHLQHTLLSLTSEGISSNDNDTTIPTSVFVKDYVDGQLGGGGGSVDTVSSYQSTSTDDAPTS